MEDAPVDATPEFNWSQYEAIVQKRRDYYLLRFGRFARGGWISWNWAAFFATLAWLRYRRLYGWSWLYVLFSTPFLLVFAMLPMAGDACGAALDPAPGEVAHLVIPSLIVLGWILPPLVADRIYFDHVRALVREAEHAIAQGHDAQRELARRGGTRGIAGALALQIFVLVGAAVTLPSYANYSYRSWVSEGILLAAAARTPLQEYIKDHGRLPARINEVAATTSGKYVSSVEMKTDGTIRAIFGDGAVRLAGYSVLMVPSWKNGEIVEWTCRSNDLPNKCLPASCRSDNLQDRSGK